jgi:hypothetical protein
MMRIVSWTVSWISWALKINWQLINVEIQDTWTMFDGIIFEREGHRPFKETWVNKTTWETRINQ